jgi:hypothetical protein
MKGYKAKIKNRIPCAGVIGGVTEIPPDTPLGERKKIRGRKGAAGGRKRNTASAQTFLFPLPRQTAVRTVYDNSNLTTPGLIRVLIVCLFVVIYLMLFN